MGRVGGGGVLHGRDPAGKCIKWWIPYLPTASAGSPAQRLGYPPGPARAVMCRIPVVRMPPSKGDPFPPRSGKLLIVAIPSSVPPVPALPLILRAAPLSLMTTCAEARMPDGVHMYLLGNKMLHVGGF